MIKDSKTKKCVDSNKILGCCKIEAVVSVDDRGQMVLPKEVRNKAGICPGDKLTVVSWRTCGKVSCISLIKTEDFEVMMKGFLEPIAKDMFENN